MKGRSGNAIYLMGTSHVVEGREIPFPSSYYAAYQDSRDVFLEVDEDAFRVKLMALGALPSMLRFFADHHRELKNLDGRKLSDSLSPKTDKLLREHYGSSYSEKQNLTPLGLLFTHELMDDSGPEQGGVDDYFNFVTHRDHKKTRSLDDHSVVGTIKLKQVDAVTGWPELNVTRAEQRMIYSNGSRTLEIGVVAANDLEKEVLVKRILEAAKEAGSSNRTITMGNRTHVESGSQHTRVWWLKDWLFFFRARDVDPDIGGESLKVLSGPTAPGAPVKVEAEGE